jgi:hypothetical protein
MYPRWHLAKGEIDGNKRTCEATSADGVVWKVSLTPDNSIASSVTRSRLLLSESSVVDLCLVFWADHETVEDGGQVLS